jgi:F-type H+-transporting ATPase subunit b
VGAIIPNLGELIPALVSFAIVFFVLSKFGWPAISDMLDKRADTIREGLERAESARIEAERLLEEYKKTMAEARKEAGSILQSAKQAAEAQRAEAAAKTQAEIDAMLVKARESIEGERRAAIASLQSSVADLSVAVAGKIIGGELTVADQHAVIEKYINEAGSLNAN